MATVIYATKANLDKYYRKYGNRLVMYSPYTGEQYSANPGDYFMTPASHKFKDASRHVMRLVVRGGVQLRQLTVRRKMKHPTTKRR